jgi:hypothetical protein
MTVRMGELTFIRIGFPVLWFVSLLRARLSEVFAQEVMRKGPHRGKMGSMAGFAGRDSPPLTGYWGRLPQNRVGVRPVGFSERLR